jgi:hypothetical protein
MVFVRWHYRAGVYVRSHLRRTQLRVGAGQTSLLPNLVAEPTRRTTPLAPDPLPATPVAGQVRLPLGA